MTSTVPDWLPNMLQNESFLQYHSYYHVSMYNKKVLLRYCKRRTARFGASPIGGGGGGCGRIGAEVVPLSYKGEGGIPLSCQGKEGGVPPVLSMDAPPLHPSPCEQTDRQV